MKLLRMNSSSLAGRFPNHPQSASSEGGQLTHSGERGTTAGVAALDPFPYQDMRWCANCGGPQMFIPVDRFIGGWRGYCLGCEQEKYVMDERTNAEAC